MSGQCASQLHGLRPLAPHPLSRPPTAAPGSGRETLTAVVARRTRGAPAAGRARPASGTRYAASGRPLCTSGVDNRRVIADWWDPGRAERVGETPDYRFSLANERTFLAWIRTGLALMAGGLACAQFLP